MLQNIWNSIHMSEIPTSRHGQNPRNGWGVLSWVFALCPHGGALVGREGKKLFMFFYVFCRLVVRGVFAGCSLCVADKSLKVNLVYYHSSLTLVADDGCCKLQGPISVWWKEVVWKLEKLGGNVDACHWTGKKKQALAVTLSLTGRARDAALKISVDDLNNNGMKTILETLDTVYEKEKDCQYDAYTEFHPITREHGILMVDYIIEFESKYNKLRHFDMILPDTVLAFKMLHTVGFSVKSKQFLFLTLQTSSPGLDTDGKKLTMSMVSLPTSFYLVKIETYHQFLLISHKPWKVQVL